MNRCATIQTGGNPNRSLFPLLFGGIIVVAMIVFAISVSMDSYHGAKHGNEADEVNRCMESNGPIQIWMGQNSKFYGVCDLGNGGYGVSIVAKNVGERIKRITDFFKTSGANGKLDPLPKVESYLAGPNNSLGIKVWDASRGFAEGVNTETQQIIYELMQVWR